MPYTGYGKIKALVVDDFNNFRMTLAKMLEEFGCTSVRSVGSGEAAIKACVEERVDLMLCDFNLGSGKSGQQVLEELRHRNILKPGSLFVMISAETSVSIVLSAYDYAPDAYLTKPITANTLRKRLDRLLAQRQSMLPLYKAIASDDKAAAIASAEKAIAEGGRYTLAYQKLLGDLYLEQNQFDKGQALFESVLQVRSLEWAQLGMARIKHARKELDTALKWLDRIIELSPYCLKAYDLKADIYRQNGDREGEQKIQQQVVEMSPMSILRQESLAKTAEQNRDYSVSARAYSKTVKLGNNSCHDRIDNHFAFGQAAAALLDSDDPDAMDISKEAIRVLEAASQQVGPGDDRHLGARLLECRIYSKRGEKQNAAEKFVEISRELEESGVALSLENSLELASTQLAVGKQASAEQLLASLVSKYKDNEAALEKIDPLLEEPCSPKNRKKLAILNKQGIEAYGRKDNAKAIESFRVAQRHFPRNIGVQLNLLQALVAQVRAGESIEDGRDECKLISKRVRDNINEQHSKFGRWQQLNDALSTL